MNERIEKLIYRVLKENDNFRCNDSYIWQMLIGATECERLKIIREEYKKIINIDDISMLMGFYPSIPFTELNVVNTGYIDVEIENKFKSQNQNVFIPGGNHSLADFEYVLKNGINGYLREIENKIAETTDKSQKKFLGDMYFAGQAIIAWSNAYADALYEKARNENSKLRRDELIQMANICSTVPSFGATSFREAIQSYFFIFILFPDGLGRLDQYLYPFYFEDIKKGVLTRDDALNLIEELFIKIFAFLGKNEERSGNNHCVIGGYTENEECGHNDCTSLILEAITELPIWRPQVSYRVTKKTSAIETLEVILANYKRPDVIMFLNDDVIINGLEIVGIDRKDAINYSSSGCNETMLSGCSQMGALEGHVNIMHGLEKLLGDRDKLSLINDFDSFYKAYEKNLCEDLDFIFKYSFYRDKAYAEIVQATKSLLTSGCISSAIPVDKGGAKYNFCTWCLTGLTNLANSLSIIKQMVFEEKHFSLLEISNFLMANWQGYEGDRAYILNNGKFFGGDDDYVDLLVNKVAKSVNAFAKKYTPYRGGRYLFGTLTGYELSHLYFGKDSGASIDGRFAGDPFSASISLSSDAAKKGLTSYLKSASKIDETLIQSSVVVNLKLDKALADSSEKQERINAILRAYFDLGGIQLQINYLSADELIKAQESPEKYKNLRVRVTGFSGFFTAFDKDLQDEIIERYLYTK